jgi:hypothetical protein
MAQQAIEPKEYLEPEIGFWRADGYLPKIFCSTSPQIMCAITIWTCWINGVSAEGAKRQ